MANTRDVLGDQATLDGLVSNTLTEIEDDGVTKLCSYALYNRSSLTRVKFPNLLSIGASAFQQCTGLTTLDFEKVSEVRFSAFSNCTNLQHLIFRNNSKVSSVGKMFPNISTKIGQGKGAIYVPADLVESYKSDSNYNTCCVLPISAYPSSTFESVTETWQQIEANGGENLFVGDRKLVTIGNNSYLAVLVGKSLDTLVNGGTANTSWIFLDVYETHAMNTDPTNYSGYGSSELRTHIINDILPNFELKNLVKEVVKTSLLNSGTNETTNEKLWIPSAKEFGGSYEKNTFSYGYFNSENIQKYYNDEKVNLWTRSVVSGGWIYVTSYGNFTGGGPHALYGVVLGFCL